MNRKQGFMTVYICIFLLTVISVTMMIIGGVREEVIQSNGQSLSRVWAQSVLAEYDLNLAGRYHLFGFYGYPAEIKEKLGFYAEKSFEGKENITWEIDSCDLYPYTLVHVDEFKKQMVTVGKLIVTETLEPSSYAVIPTEDHITPGRGILLTDLPSEGCHDDIPFTKLAELLKGCVSIGELVKKGTEQYFEIAYIMTHFKDKRNQNHLGDTYFDNELEYILEGKSTDSANENSVRNKILAVREFFNLLYLEQNQQRCAEALAVAELMTPGPAAVATQQTLLALWAAAESFNDYKLLSNGYPVLLVKSEASWATDLQSVVENQSQGKGFIYTGADEGDNYEDYLRLFLYLSDERVRTLRVMDLIQINFRYLYYDEFLLSNYHGGLRFRYRLNGKQNQVEMCYEKE